MKHYVFLISLFLTWYIAGMYRSMPLMILFILQLVTFTILIVTPFYFRGNLKIRFQDAAITTKSGSSTKFKLILTNAGMLAISRISSRIVIKYSDGDGYNPRFMSSADVGDNMYTVAFRPTKSGILDIRLEKALVYDYISLYSIWKKVGISKEVIVLPKDLVLNIKEKSGGILGNTAGDDLVSKETGSGMEFDQVREYRPGDLYRNIHWKLSSKQDEPIVKTFNNEVKANTLLMISIDTHSNRETKYLDAIYNVIYATLNGLIKQSSRLTVYYRVDNTNKMMLITNKDDIDRFIVVVMKNGLQDNTEELLKEAPGNDVFMIKEGLEIYLGNKLLHKFDTNNIEADIEATVINL